MGGGPAPREPSEELGLEVSRWTDGRRDFRASETGCRRVSWAPEEEGTGGTRATGHGAA